MIFDLSNPYHIQRYKEYVNKLYEAKKVVEVKEKKPNRTIKQNKYLHLLLSYFANETGYSLDEVKVDFFKRKCNKNLFDESTINKRGEEIVRLRSSRDLTTAEMTTAIERFRNWSSSEAGIYLPSANESEYLAYIEQEVSRGNIFI